MIFKKWKKKFKYLIIILIFLKKLNFSILLQVKWNLLSHNFNFNILVLFDIFNTILKLVSKSQNKI